MSEKKIQTRLQLAQNLYEEGKISESMESLHSLEPVDNYSERQKAIFYTLISKNHLFLGNVPKASETAEKGMFFANKIEKSIEVIDAFLNMAATLFALKKRQESLTLLKECSNILQNLSQISEQDRNRRMGLISHLKGNNFYVLGEIKNAIENYEDSIERLETRGRQVHLAHVYAISGYSYMQIGDYDKALHNITRSQKICENKKSPHYNHSKMTNIFARGNIYIFQGELHLALESYQKGLAMARKYNNLFHIRSGLNNIGMTYKELGNWPQAIKYLKEALPLAEKSGNITGLVGLLDSFFQVYINMGDIPAAQHIFQRIEQIRAKNKEEKVINLLFRLNRAILLKLSSRTRDLGIAQNIFNRIAHEEVMFLDATQSAILHLCEMLLDEFKDMKNVEALDEFSSFLKNLKDAAKKQHAYPILVEIYVLDAKLNMIYFDLKKARRSLTKAQQIAEQYGLKRLVLKISYEHDNLLHNLEMWEQMKKDNVVMSERLEKSDINYQISVMLKKEWEEIQEPAPESPIVLLIMAKSGLPLYTKIFSNEWKFSEGIFSGFLSAFSSFSDQIFSEGLDRANFGKYTILMTGMPPFRSCYVFKGHSFLAHQKFSQFNESIHNSEQIWQNLTTADKKGQKIRDDVGNGLGFLVKTIFKNKSGNN